MPIDLTPEQRITESFERLEKAQRRRARNSLIWLGLAFLMLLGSIVAEVAR